jgi:hypothetical protein
MEERLAKGRNWQLKAGVVGMKRFMKLDRKIEAAEFIRSRVN